MTQHSPPARHYFVTGTDTEVGKTHVSCALLRQAAARGWRSLALKPVAAGAEPSDSGWVNEDAVRLMAHASVALPYEAVNPVLLRRPIAPHLAAEAEGVSLTVDALAAHCREVLQTPHDLGLVEGAGGWLVPLNARETLADLAVALGFPVLLVVGLRLGCLNHALLTVAAIRASGLPLAGWIGNPCSDQPMAALEGNLATLQEWIPAPLLGVLPRHPDPAAVADRLDLRLD